MKHLILLLSLFFANQLASQITISGIIHDDEQQPLEFANVLLMNASDSTLYKGTVTEQGGQYNIPDVKDGSYFIESSMVGLGKAKSEIFDIINQSDFTLPTLILTNGIEIEEVTVTAKKPFIELKADKMVVNVANSAVNAGNTALEVLEKSPGVIVDNNNNIILRGKQGVLVTINGKNQYLSGDEITRLLETMPSTNIQSIEIITNPSAKYEAQGNSGIINIVLKKNENLGTNGNISTTFRQGWKSSHFHNINLNHRTEKVNIYGSGEYYNWGWAQDLSLMRDIEFNGGSTLFDQMSEMSETGDGYNAKLGADWSVTDKTTIGLMMRRNAGDEQDFNDNVTNISGNNKPIYDRLASETLGSAVYSSNTYNANINHKLNDNGVEITWDADFSDYKNDQNFNYDNFFLDNNNDEIDRPYYLRNTQLIDIDILASTLDFTYPVSEKLKLETGAKLSMVTTVSETEFESQDNEGQWIVEPQRTNDFMYEENVYAAYINGSGQLGKFMMQGGLRVEHTESDGISQTIDSRTKRSYTNLFPSLSLSRTFAEKHNVSVSYSRRLERPSYQKLNPFIDFLDQYTFQKGNPLLNPQYSNAIGVNYALGNALFVALNYSNTTDAIFDIIEQDSETNTTFQTNANLDDINTASLTISAPKVWTEWWTTRFNYSGFYNEFKSSLEDGSILDNASSGHNINISNEINLGNGYNFEVSTFYQSKLVYGQLTIDPTGSLDLGISKRFFDNKLSIKMGIDDVFHTRNNDVYIDQNGINLLVDQQNDTRRATINLAYSFGNQKVKRARKRKTSSEAESGRI